MTKIPPTKQTVWGHFDHFGKLVLSTTTRKGLVKLSLAPAEPITQVETGHLGHAVAPALSLFPCSETRTVKVSFDRYASLIFVIIRWEIT
jgi:hypothetical protein